ncbi:MAG: GldG family protein [Tyzzerella sp.]|nr:GldG family protein [Tyzzerella sp.]
MKKIKEILKSPQLRYGTYSTAVTVVAIVIVVIVNMIASQFSEAIDNIDLSDSKIYEITDTSKDFLDDLDKEVKLYVLADKSTADERIKTFISKYDALFKKVSVEWIDPVAHPSALTEYGASSDTVVVRCEETDKQEIVALSDMIVYDYSSYYTTGYAAESEFDAEGQITSAIYSVTSEVSKKIYYTSGHGEATFSDTISSLMDKSNFETEELNTLMTAEVPEDCDLLFLYAPTTDFTEDEKTMVSEYIQGGGDVFYILGITSNETPNLDALLAEYGMQKAEGYIADTQRCYQGNPYYIFPELSVSDDLANNISTEMVLLVQALGVTETTPERDTITLESFMATSSAGGYAVTDESNAVQGEYILGAVATEDEGQFTVITSESMIDASITDSFGTLENTTLFMNAVTNHFEDVENISIDARSLEITYNTVQYAGLFGLLFIFGIPVIILIYGFVKWLKRRKA